MKIPATEPGPGAIEDSIAAGRSINVTLIFSLERYTRGDRGLHPRARAARRVAAATRRRCARSRSFFVSRVDTEADKRLEAIGSDQALALRGRLAIANAKLAYRQYQELFQAERWKALEAKGAHPQRCLWASTSTKNPEYRDVLYVEELIGPDTVNTMPEETIARLPGPRPRRRDADAGRRRGASRLLEELARGRRRLRRRDRMLEEEGVQKFSDSFRDSRAGHRRQAQRLRDRMSETADLVQRIWARDPTVWTGGDEAQWLGWLDEPLRMRERIEELEAFAEAAVAAFDHAS